jgi:hypothetical protein
MTELCCIESIALDEGGRSPGAITIKFNEKVLVLPVWRTMEAARRFMSECGMNSDHYVVKPFSLDVFDQVDKWAAGLGLNLFIQPK